MFDNTVFILFYLQIERFNCLRIIKTRKYLSCHSRNESKHNLKRSNSLVRTGSKRKSWRFVSLQDVTVFREVSRRLRWVAITINVSSRGDIVVISCDNDVCLPKSANNRTNRTKRSTTKSFCIRLKWRALLLNDKTNYCIVNICTI